MIFGAPRAVLLPGGHPCPLAGTGAIAGHLSPPVAFYSFFRLGPAAGRRPPPPHAKPLVPSPALVDHFNTTHS